MKDIIATKDVFGVSPESHTMNTVYTPPKHTEATMYVVIGRTGEYSDRREWPVVAFFTEEEANTYRGELLEAVRALGCGRGDERARNFTSYTLSEEIENDPEYAGVRPLYRRVRSLDPSFHTDYTGTDYTIWKVPTLRINPA